MGASRLASRRSLSPAQSCSGEGAARQNGARLGPKGAAQQVGPDGDAGAGKLGDSNVQESALLRPHCERDEVIVRPGAGVRHRSVVPWLSHRAGDRSDSASGAH